MVEPASVGRVERGGDPGERLVPDARGEAGERHRGDAVEEALAIVGAVVERPLGLLVLDHPFRGGLREGLVAVEDVLRGEGRIALELGLEGVRQLRARLVNAFELGLVLEFACADGPGEESVALRCARELECRLLTHDPRLLLHEGLHGLPADAGGKVLQQVVVANTRLADDFLLHRADFILNALADGVLGGAGDGRHPGEGLLHQLRAVLDVLFKRLTDRGGEVVERAGGGDVEPHNGLGGGGGGRVEPDDLLEDAFAADGVVDMLGVHLIESSDEANEEIAERPRKAVKDFLFISDRNLNAECRVDFLAHYPISLLDDPVGKIREIAAGEGQERRIYIALRIRLHMFDQLRAALSEEGVATRDEPLLHVADGRTALRHHRLAVAHIVHAARFV